MSFVDKDFPLCNAIFGPLVIAPMKALPDVIGMIWFFVVGSFLMSTIGLIIVPLDLLILPLFRKK